MIGPKSGTQPLTVVVDDSPSNIRQYTRAFEKRGCRVLSATNFKDAQDIVLNTPGIDLVFTDINFNPPDQVPNKDGVELARLLREKFDTGLPLVGCTGAFTELPRDERQLFDVAVGKAGRAPAQMRKLYDDCAKLAEMRRAKRSVVSDDQLLDLKRRHPNIESGTIEHSKRNATLTPTSIDDIEQEIANAGYELRLLSSELFVGLAQPVIVWYRQSENSVELEVYGQPVLYSAAASEKIAFQELLSLMVGFSHDLAEFASAGQEPIGPAKQLAEFLKVTLA